MEDVDHLIVTGLHARAVAGLKKALGVPAERVVPDHAGLVGNLGVAQAGLQLADVLDRASPGQVVAVLELADGADAAVLRTTDALPSAQAARRQAGIRAVADLVNDGRSDLAYAFPVLAGHAPPGAAPPARPRAARRAG